MSAAARSSSRGFPGAVATCCLLLLLPPLLLPPLLLPPPPLLPAAGAPSGGQHRCQGQGGLQAGEEEELVRREGGGQAKPMPCSAAFAGRQGGQQCWGLQPRAACCATRNSAGAVTFAHAARQLSSCSAGWGVCAHQSQSLQQERGASGSAVSEQFKPQLGWPCG